MKPTACTAVLAASVLLVAWGVPVSSEAGLKVKFKSGNFKASYNSGGYYDGRGYYGGKGFRRGYYPRRYYGGYYAPYAFWGPTVYSVNYGYPGPVNYLPQQYAPQPETTTSTTSRETVSNSPGAIIINSENTVIYNNAPGAPAGETTEQPTTQVAPVSTTGQLSQTTQTSQPIRYQYAGPRSYGY